MPTLEPTVSLASSLGAGAVRVERSQRLAATHDGNSTGKRPYIAQLVRDQYDSSAALGDFPPRASKRLASSSVSTAVGSSRMRMRAPAISTLISRRAAARRSIARSMPAEAYIEIEAEGFDCLLDFRSDRLLGASKISARVSEQNILDRSKPLHQLEVLVDHADALARRIAGAGKSPLDTGHPDHARDWGE